MERGLTGGKRIDDSKAIKWNTGFLLLLGNFGRSFTVAHFVVAL